METSYAELKCKQVINVVDGKCLGRIIDLVLDVKTCKILGLVVPSPSCNSWSLFRKAKSVFVPFNCICKIGVDVILIELIEPRLEPGCYAPPPPPPKPICKPNKCKTFTLKDNDYNIK